MKGIDIFFKTLIKDGVDHVFSPPNSFGPTIDKLFKNKYSKNLKNIISGNFTFFQSQKLQRCA